jgi:hypothetical protein
MERHRAAGMMGMLLQHYERRPEEVGYNMDSWAGYAHERIE